MNDTAVHSLGIGLATHNAKQQIIEVYYPQPLLSPDPSAQQCTYAVMRYLAE